MWFCICTERQEGQFWKGLDDGVEFEILVMRRMNATKNIEGKTNAESLQASARENGEM